MKEIASQAFNIEYEATSPEAALYGNIVSYLGEYRLQVQKYNYKLQFSGSSPRELHLRDNYQGEPMYLKAKRAIEERKKRGLPIHREEAELQALGDPDNPRPESLASQLSLAEDGDTVTWGSPPGPREEGYGDYGFIFIGQIRKRSLLDMNLDMTAIRVEHPTLNQYNGALSDVTGGKINFTYEDDFLKHPFVKRGRVEEAKIDTTLYKNFSFEVRDNDQQIFHKVITHLKPIIQEFIHLVKVGTKEEKLKAFYAIENYALELKEQFCQDSQENIIYLNQYRSYAFLRELVPAYGYQPAVVAGSCGSTGDMKSNNILSNNYDILRKALGLDDWFTCPKCGYQADGPVGDCCPSCGITKEDYARDSGEKICA